MTRIGFSVPATFNPFSLLIRWFTGSKVSHAWIVYFDLDFRRAMVLEAAFSGFRLIPLSVFKKKNKIQHIVTPVVDIDKGLREAGDWLARSYDYQGLLGMALVILAKRFRRPIKNMAASNKGLFCSEAVVLVLKASGHPNADTLNASSTSPEDLLRFLQASTKRTIPNGASNG